MKIIQKLTILGILFLVSLKILSVPKDQKNEKPLISKSSIEDIYQLSNGEKYPIYESGNSLGFMSEPVTIHFTLDNPTKVSEKFYLEVKNSFIQRIKLYRISKTDKNGIETKTVLGISGSSIEKEVKSFPHKNHIFPIEMEPLSKNKFELEIDTRTFINLSLKVFSEDSLRENLLRETFFYAFIFGTLIFALLFS